MRDHGAEPVLDLSLDNLESNLESVIRELRTVMKESIAEGGQYTVDLSRWSSSTVTFALSFRNGNVPELGDEFNIGSTRG